jgi:hypothetical protein
MSKVLKFSKRRLRIYRGITLLHSEKNGGPVLKGESSWKTINGLLINSPWGHVQFIFRRR